MPSKISTVTDGDNARETLVVAAASADTAFFHNSIAAQHIANAAIGAEFWRPESAPTGGRSISPSPLLSRLARGAGRQRHQSESPTGRPARSADRRAGSSNSGHRSYSTSTNIVRYGSTRSASASSGAPPPLTREEFEALPVAIQRKYFSTLERLRFAQDSGIVDGICQHYDAISAQKLKRRKSRQHPSASEHFAGRLRRRSLRESPVTDSQFYATLPDKIKKRQFSREEQVLLAGQLRASVILDAADEAVYKIGRRASTWQLVPNIKINSPTLSTRRSMESVRGGTNGRSHDMGPLDVSSKRSSGVPESFYDCFRWVDEDEDLDLRLFLDDYHANLRESIPQQNKERQPSFRRRMSVSKIPFSLPLSEPSRPATKDAASAASMSPSADTSPFPAVPFIAPSHSPIVPQHNRRKSRALSLITPKHAPHTSVSSIDPSAAHYQDPEARLKLRVYLASPQKFDEAIEFGFPSTEGVSEAAAAAGTGTIDTSSQKRKRMDSRRTVSDSSNAMQTFLDDEDEDKLDADEASVPDPESPRTPNLMETSMHGHGASKAGFFRPGRLSTADPTIGHRPSDSYAQVPVSSREMTLRMTLTRPDLRACEDHIYGWQQAQPSPSGRKSQSPLREDMTMGSGSSATYIGSGGRPKESIDQLFAGIDHWGHDPPEMGMMKRFWNRMRRA